MSFISYRYGLSSDDFDKFYARHHELLDESAWRHYYSSSFLTQSSTHRFWRLPDLKDLPDSDDQTGLHREKGPGRANKLPYWAHNVVQTYHRQPLLSTPKMVEIALQTLKQSILRLQANNVSVESYSETQARFWLEHLHLNRGRSEPRGYGENALYYVSEYIPAGRIDVLSWQKFYTAHRWLSAEGRTTFLAPDADGSEYHVLKPDNEFQGGNDTIECYRGWTPEIGSEEEIDFLASVAIEELRHVTDLGALDYVHRSHMLMAILRIAEADDQADATTTLGREFLKTTRFEDSFAAEEWINQALDIMRPYVRHWTEEHVALGTDTRNRMTLLGRILLENGQLFGRYKFATENFEGSIFELRSRRFRSSAGVRAEEQTSSRAIS